MDKQQARFILQSSRPEGCDADDPRFTEAWQVVESDPELAARLAGERALDLAISASLQDVPVPAIFPARLLAGLEALAAARRRRRVLTFALAASVMLLLSITGAAFVRGRAAVSFSNYRQEMVGRLDGRLQLTFASDRPVELQQWLETRRAVSGAVIPAGLQSLPGIGCRTWTWNGRPAGLICFLVNGREAVHLFVVSRAAVPRAPHGESPEFGQVGNWQTASWTRGDNVYVLAGQMDRDSLERLL